MVDTVRSEADLLTNLFPDGQAAGSITANTIRDLIVSLKQSNCSVALTTPAATTIAVAGTYAKAAGVTAFSADTTDLTDDGSTDNRFKYVGTPNRHFEIAITLSMTCASSNQILGFKIAKNGVVIDESVTRRKQGTSSDLGAISLIAHVDLVTNDYIEVWCTNETSTGAVTVENMFVKASGFLG
jgi:hypothetical protein